VLGVLHQRVDDSLDSILTLAKTEGMLFKWGSGTGTNLSSLRGSMELLSGGGQASGPLSFMRGFDAFAGVIKSGGKTRRAAKMVILNVDHPDIVDFIECKSKEEAKAFTLIKAGYDGSGRIPRRFRRSSSRTPTIRYGSVTSSCAPTRPMGLHHLYGEGPRAGEDLQGARDHGQDRRVDVAVRRSGHAVRHTINKWHTSKNTARINASNPCSEYMFLDNSACNLASLNLMKFVTPAGHVRYRSVPARDLGDDHGDGDPGGQLGISDRGHSRNSHDYRPLGLGYANLGALLMAFGLPYDSEAGRDLAAA
jgi:ribonucleoside-diphosphate reductase alpha chain